MVYIQVTYDSDPGSSGSAVFNENRKCIGMAFQGSKKGDTGNVIPVTIIKHFIQDYDRNGEYTGIFNCSIVISPFFH